MNILFVIMFSGLGAPGFFLHIFGFVLSVKEILVSLCTSQGKHQTYGKFFTLLIHSLKIADHFALGYYHSTGETLFSSFPSFR